MGFDLETRNANDRLVRSVKGNTTELEAIKAKQDTVINATIRDINNTGSIGDRSSNAHIAKGRGVLAPWCQQ